MISSVVLDLQFIPSNIIEDKTVALNSFVLHGNLGLKFHTKGKQTYRVIIKKLEFEDKSMNIVIIARLICLLLEITSLKALVTVRILK